ncbi:MAG: SH3 domain-containing protein [Clostridia bacterium]|nr:SH3 domain-containing protein [Clostridia bacterium]
MRAKRAVEKKKGNMLKKIIVTILFLICICVVINIAPNYVQNEIKGKVNLIINNNNVTKSLKYDVIVDENEVIYLSSKDIGNFFDQNIFYDNVYNQIITTSGTKVATIEPNKKEMYVNSSKVNIYATMTKKDNTFYLPFSEMKNVYNVDVKYSKETGIVTIDSLNKEQKMGNSSNDTNVKYKPTVFSKTLDKIKKGESVVVIEKKDGWNKIRTSKGIIGYVKDVANIHNIRENMEQAKQIEGKISLVWDYYTSTVPTRTENIDGVNVVSPSFAYLKNTQGDLQTKIGDAGRNYINWAHNCGYKVWAAVSNSEVGRTATSEVLNDYKLREKLINSIVLLTTNYNLDGINIDFEYMNEEDKGMFSQFLIELAPRLKEYGKVLSVDVTAPDGSPNWSLCYDRNKIGQVADYIIFMGYDQYGESSTEAGTTAGADWVEVNVNKFIGTQEEVDENKLILGMPFYTRLWKEKDGKTESTVVWMKNIDSKLPAGIQKNWDENLKQYYVEYDQNGYTYKMWIEDEQSIKAKFDIMNKYNLAGAAYWQKDFESSNIWNIVKEEINK